MKNVTFWWTSCWCHSKNDRVRGGLKSDIYSFSSPSIFQSFWATSTWCTSKDHFFFVELKFQLRIYFLKWKNLKKNQLKNTTSSCCWKWSFYYVIFPKSSTNFRQRLERSNFENFTIFPHIIFQKILNLPEKVGKDQFWNSLHRN